MKMTGLAAAVLAAGVFACAGSAEAKVPFFNATCGDGVEVHADEGGPVYINGKEAQLTTINDKAYEAHKGKVTISITISPDGSVEAAATWKGGANGICTVAADADG
jgi:hypothetical protein